MAKTKILYLITKDDVGGAQKYVGDLAQNISKDKFDVKILTGGTDGARFLSNDFFPHLLFVNDLAALGELFFTLKRERPDILHLNSSKAGVVGAIAAKLAGVPKVVFTAHGWVFNPVNQLSFLRRKFYTLLHKAAAKFQDHIINVSEYDKQLAIKCGLDEKKLITIHNGVDPKKMKFFDKKTARKAISKLITEGKVSATNNDIWIGSIGRLVVEKSYEDLIKAASLIKNPAVKFFIIGNGYEAEKLKAQIAKNKLQEKFFIVENVSPASPYLKAFNIFALSSIKEGLPYTLLEAMIAGVPVVTTRVGGMTEIVDPANGAGKRGIVMPPNQPEELARAINYLLDNPKLAAKLAVEGKTFIKNRLTLSGLLKNTEKIYLA